MVWSITTTLLNIIHVRRRTTSTIYLIYKSTPSRQYQKSVVKFNYKIKTKETTWYTSLMPSNVDPGDNTVNAIRMNEPYFLDMVISWLFQGCSLYLSQATLYSWPSFWSNQIKSNQIQFYLKSAMYIWKKIKLARSYLPDYIL